MSSGSKLCTFLWRRLFLQTLRRHYLALLGEIVFVLATFTLFLSSDRVDLTCVNKINSTYIRNVVRKQFRVEALRHKVAVVYGPSNDRTDKLVKRLLDWMHSDIPGRRPHNDYGNGGHPARRPGYGNLKEPRDYPTKLGEYS
ncbi:hypothetical protein HPB49_015358 [Dermacentor silvarum]|uniref:Uncharacterized protein n=1 Tax=Dermacentor silvarum TaxID=543639 RepID=A0ACB8CLR2_DERSI|nr:hypothetical protein HPB49_015358 [Dermacentor silvarum]